MSHTTVNPMKNSYAYKEAINFSCSEGYQLRGSILTTCGDIGHFQGRLPTCTGWVFSSLSYNKGIKNSSLFLVVTCQKSRISDIRLSVYPLEGLYAYMKSLPFLALRNTNLSGHPRKRYR